MFGSARLNSDGVIAGVRRSIGMRYLIPEGVEALRMLQNGGFRDAVAGHPMTPEEVSGIACHAARILALHETGLDVLPDLKRLQRRLEGRMNPCPGPGPLVRELAEKARESREAAERFVRDRGLDLRRCRLPNGASLRLFIPKSIFPPSGWTQLLLESLLSGYGPGDIKGKTGIELGTGSGVVAIAIALGGASLVTGLDLNPEAPLVAFANAILNWDRDGSPPLVFRESDLLDTWPVAGKADFLVGCLPEVVDHRPEEIGLRQSADVCPPEEDETGIGFGLLDRALRHAHATLRGEGWARFVASGRRGFPRVFNLFRRNGFDPQTSIRRLVPQDSEPALEVFERIERESGIPYRFWRPSGGPPVSASEAREQGLQGLNHDLAVVRALPYPVLERVSRRETLKEINRAGYTADPGVENRLLAHALTDLIQMRTGVAFDSGLLFIGPAFRELLHHVLLTMLDSSDRLAATEEAEIYLNRGRSPFITDALDDLIARHSRSGAKKEKLRLMTVQELEGAVLVDGRNVVLDFPGEAGGSEHAVLRRLKYDRRFVENTIFMGDLTRDFLFQSGQLSFALVPNAALYRDLMCFGEATYSRAAVLPQAILARLIRKIAPPAGRLGEPRLNLRERRPSVERFCSMRSRSLRNFPSMRMNLGSSLRHPDSDLIRLDFGESEWGLPEPVLEGLRDWDGGSSVDGASLESWSRIYLDHTRGLTGQAVVSGSGVLPVEAAIVRALRDSLGRQPVVYVPNVNYDVHRPMIVAAGGKPVLLNTQETKIIAASLGTLHRRMRGDALLLSQPTNPGGQYYTPTEIRRIASELPGVLWISDEVLGLLTLKEGASLTSPASVLDRDRDAHKVLTLFGLSKEFGTLGGMRAGFAAVPSEDDELVQAIRRQILTPIDRMATRAAILAFSRPAILEPHREFLRERLGKMEERLGTLGIPFLSPQGGLSLLADFSPLFGTKKDGVSLDIGNLAEVLEKEEKIRIHPPGWSGTTRVRLVFSIRDLDPALDRLERFWKKFR